jgi:hypothetical protein
VKYLLLIYSNPKSWDHPLFLQQHDELSDVERAGMTEEFVALMTEISESGELVGSEPLADPASATTVRTRDGVPVTTDGPFAEAKEQLAGYFVLECSQERAVAIAARFPDARFGAVEVRPVAQVSDVDIRRR